MFAKISFLAGLACLCSGCAGLPPGPMPHGFQNPAPVAGIDRDFLWDQLVDVVDDYFRIDREDRVRLEGDVLTVGRIDTFPQVGATLLEPFRNDSANPYEKLESTLQTIRRRAVVQLEPAGDGFLLDVAVFKELEDLPQPEYATAGGATIRHDTASQHNVPTIAGQSTETGWIPLGRDPALEQRIIGQLLARIGQIQ